MQKAIMLSLAVLIGLLGYTWAMNTATPRLHPGDIKDPVERAKVVADAQQHLEWLQGHWDEVGPGPKAQCPSPKQVEAMLEAGKPSEAKCSREQLAAIDSLVDLNQQAKDLAYTRGSSRYELSHNYVPYMVEQLNRQLEICHPIIEAQMRAAVETLPAKTLEEVNKLAAAMNGRGSWKDQLINYHWFGYRMFDRLGPYLTAHNLNSKSPQRSFERHFEGVCGEVSRKLGPLARVLDQPSVRFQTPRRWPNFTTEWILKGSMCADIMEAIKHRVLIDT